MEEVLQIQKQELEDLLDCDEVKPFIALSKGLKILYNQCDAIFLDTSVLCSGFASFDIDIDSPNLRWIKKYRKMYFYIPELVRVYHDLQKDIITETNFTVFFLPLK